MSTVNSWEINPNHGRWGYWTTPPNDGQHANAEDSSPYPTLGTNPEPYDNASVSEPTPGMTGGSHLQEAYQIPSFPNTHSSNAYDMGALLEGLEDISRPANVNTFDESVIDPALLQPSGDMEMGGIEQSVQQQNEYRSVRVAIIDWDRGDTKKDTEGDLQDLQFTFQNLYSFDVTRISIQSQNPRQSLLQGLREVYQKAAAQPALVILYYIGHGMNTWNAYKSRWQMIWARDANPYTTTGIDRVPGLDWTDAQEALGTVDADIILIFQCSSAGNAARLFKVGGIPRGMEIIAAAEDPSSAWPSSQFFTKEIINALRRLSDKAFTGMDLFHEIDQSKVQGSPYHYAVNGESGSRLIKRLGHRDSGIGIQALGAKMTHPWGSVEPYGCHYF